jgi:hypothetical protein
MDKDLEQQLIQKYPLIFVEVHLPVDRSSMAWGLTVGDGWYSLIDVLCNYLQYRTDKKGDPQVVAAQVKEKFGLLRFYCRQEGSDAQFGAIELAEVLSGKICEECGSMTDVQQTGGGWVRSLCAVHRAERERLTNQLRPAPMEETSE